MSLPRQVLPGQFYLVTRRCTQRQFLLRPDAATNNAFTYCLIEAAQRTQVEVLLPCAMSNHHHTVIFDRYGRYPDVPGGLRGSARVLAGRRGGDVSDRHVLVAAVRNVPIAAALVAGACAQVRRAGGEFLHGSGGDEVSRLYERFAVGSIAHEQYLSGEAFQVFADLAGASARELVRRLPARELNRMPPRSRS